MFWLGGDVFFLFVFLNSVCVFLNKCFFDINILYCFLNGLFSR